LVFGLGSSVFDHFEENQRPKTKNSKTFLKMKTELVDLSPTRKEIKIEIEPAQIRTAYDRISERYAKGASVPGFRRGHAPRSVVRTRFKSEIRSDVLRELLPDAVNTAIGEHSLATIGEPDVHLDNTEALENLGEEPITVKVGVEVFPEVKLEKYKGLDAVRRTRPVRDEDVDKMIEGLRDASASAATCRRSRCRSRRHSNDQCSRQIR
jgi:trigger factor